MGLGPEAPSPALLREHPGTLGKRGRMPDVLSMPAFELCDPMPLCILVEPDDATQHRRPSGEGPCPVLYVHDCVIGGECLENAAAWKT